MQICIQLYGFKYSYLIQIIFKQIYLTNTTTSGQSVSGNDDNRDVLYTPWSSRTSLTTWSSLEHWTGINHRELNQMSKVYVDWYLNRCNKELIHFLHKYHTVILKYPIPITPQLSLLTLNVLSDTSKWYSGT